MKIHFDKVTNRVTGYTITGYAPDDALDLGVDENGDDIIFDFVKPMGEYEIQNGEIVHVGPTDEMIEAVKTELKNHYASLVQMHLDKTAQKFGYDNINSIGKYLGFDNAFRAECESLGSYNVACWSKLYEIEDSIDAGTLTIDSDDDLLSQLPIYGE